MLAGTVVEVLGSFLELYSSSQILHRVGILWATETVMDERQAPKMKGIHFMINKRKDFGPDGWDKILPGAEITIDTVNGANHFTLMSKENIQQVSNLINRVLA
ncbi:polyketide synthase [Phlyctema vagabunda]|uniref:Polyketide synthase n=1 Tax=Phlyctema vagabunda TaxID=108571 RepID=A0ABR4PCT5_9HELO